MDLANRVALVTGGSRGIGRAIAHSLVEAGAHVVITGRSAKHLDAAHAIVSGAGAGRLETIRADIRRHDEIDQAVAAAVSRFGGLDILINNAGIGWFENVAEMSVDRWTEVIETNLTGVFNACRAAIPRLKERGGGYIINVSSLASTNPFVGGAAYCASKAGLNAFSEALMQELRYDNIRVSYVMPGSVATDFSGDAAKGADWKLTPDDVAEVVLDLLKTNRRSLPSRLEIRPSQPRK
ncbi:MAG TPA: SDR family oxidoreductase [Vicinamibacterales bacterium]|jgi:NAD(P)-dependent dehydrogenase (short-subunit alcohol dehydrogenase family)|nr:SDR family oxidoreductase [Vicinamibacterales bacterium]